MLVQFRFNLGNIRLGRTVVQKPPRTTACHFQLLTGKLGVMASPDIQKLHDWLNQHEADLLNDYRELLKIPSIESDATVGAPFGLENRRALDFMLALSAQCGMVTKDIEGYCGWAEFGAGERLVLSLGHLDVVPYGPGWKHDPIGAEIEDGYVYARGALDDKGPTIASFYACRAIQACFPDIQARLRSVFGCNEESGFKCIERYVQTEETPTFGIAPDSSWPCVHGEKGIANFEILIPIHCGEFELVSMTGGQRPNIVIDSCEAVVKVGYQARNSVQEKLASAWDRNVTVNWNGEFLEIRAIGKAAHGAWPIGGDNAATRVMRFLKELAPMESQSFYSDCMQLGHIGGDGLGISGSDEPSGALTANLGVVRTISEGILFTINVRYPVTWLGQDVRDRCEAELLKKGHGMRIHSFSDSKPLYFPKDHALVKVICDVYRDETGDMTEPTTMGGGTYARAIENTISVGTGWVGDGDAHETNERCAIESLYKMSRIYAHILYKLATMPA